MMPGGATILSLKVSVSSQAMLATIEMFPYVEKVLPTLKWSMMKLASTSGRGTKSSFSSVQREGRRERKQKTETERGRGERGGEKEGGRGREGEREGERERKREDRDGKREVERDGEREGGRGREGEREGGRERKREDRDGKREVERD